MRACICIPAAKRWTLPSPSAKTTSAATTPTRSSIIGRNVTIVMEDGELDLGEFGRIHFIDWDQTRARKRTVQVMLIGE